MHLDGVPVQHMTPVLAAAGKKITTIEAVGATPEGKAVQEAWLNLDVVQCGYCQSGQIMSASALLAQSKTRAMRTLTRMGGNVCRCATYVRAFAPPSTRPPRRWVRRDAMSNALKGLLWLIIAVVVLAGGYALYTLLRPAGAEPAAPIAGRRPA
ncbi:hypothetical protein SL267_21940 [Serratia marcescens]|nr:hypothetical protein SL267_21940 [Serratia marcescens]